ncbi:MAG: hypothetical protein A2939_02700 [Parcubacteria group bacterium RIFCSPLOWO2_01_FULL_48_18]|nr:MAG: hypothetical protein A2939_02700 [Parcubacteria group bacterium RIFCSPLOWO2_01_FULL_48_18]OHB22997.1 MAG: hypothetical protein A3J67_03835 [Parcubacteria group bacterium RIFCSPHIGHO2_02_FULL_48_10b]
MIYDKDRAENVGGYLAWDNFYDVPFILEYARRVGSPVLELACGAGRASCERSQSTGSTHTASRHRAR